MSISPLGRLAPTPTAVENKPVAQPANVAQAATAAHSPKTDRIERQSQKPSTAMPQHGFGVGVTAGACAEAGVVAGAGASGSIGAGLFADRSGVHPGTFAGGGAFAGAGAHGLRSAHTDDAVNALGAYAGAGVGAFVTNAASAAELAGAAQTYSLNLGVGPIKLSLQAAAANGTYIGSISIGPGIGLDVSRYPTQSVASKQ